MVKEAVVELVQEPKEKQVYYFTFGMGHTLARHCQPILASSYGSARERMVELHGSMWAFQYTEEEYLRHRVKGTANEALLEPIEWR